MRVAGAVTGPDAGPASCELQAHKANTAMDSRATVSYTHLDVYKRQPLTRLRNRLEDLRQHQTDPGVQHKLDKALAETDQLLQSFGALLRLARIEAQPLEGDAPLQNLRELADDAVELYAPCLLYTSRCV